MSDVTAFELFDELAPSLQSIMGADTYARLRLALDHVEFATAVEIVRRIETAP